MEQCETPSGTVPELSGAVLSLITFADQRFDLRRNEDGNDGQQELRNVKLGLDAEGEIGNIEVPGVAFEVQRRRIVQPAEGSDAGAEIADDAAQDHCDHDGAEIDEKLFHRRGDSSFTTDRLRRIRLRHVLLCPGAGLLSVPG